MPRRTSDNEEIRTAQRARILEAATQVFARKGFSAARISDVAKQAGVSHGLVHHYFESKAGLHRALVEQVMASADALPRAALERSGPPWERISWFVETALLGARYAPEQFFLVIEATMNEAVSPGIHELLVAQGTKAFELLGQLLAEGQAAGVVRPGDPRRLAEHVFAMLQGLAVAQLRDRIDLDIVLGLVRVPKEVR